MIDNNKVVELKKNPAGEAILYGLSVLRQRAKAKSNMLILKQELRREGFVFSEKEFMAAAKALEALGACKLILGPKALYAEWKVRLTDLGLMSQGDVITNPPKNGHTKPKEVVKGEVIKTAKRPVIVFSEGTSEDEIARVTKAVERAYASL